MAWLLTGGAGYIGSHIIRAFHDAQIDVVVLDNLSNRLPRVRAAGGAARRRLRDR